MRGEHRAGARARQPLGFGEPHVDPGRNGGRRRRRVDAARRQPRRRPGQHGGLGPSVDRGPGEVVVEPVVEPCAVVDGVGPDGDVEQVDGRRVELGEEHAGAVDGAPSATTAEPPSASAMTPVMTSRRHRRRLLEDPPLAVDALRGICVLAAVELHLVLAAHDEHGAAQHHQGPDRRDLRRRQGPELVERPDRGQHRHGFGARVVQHGRDRDRELGDGPAARDVAEVDEPVGQPDAALRRAHHVVVGEVEVHRLSGEVGCHHAELRPRRCRGVRDPLPSRRIGMMRRQQLDDAIGDLRIPLEHAVEPGVVEVGEGEDGARGEFAHACDGRGREVGVAGERAAAEVLDDPDAERSLARVGDRRAWRAGGIRGRGGDAESWGGRCDARRAASSCASSSAAEKAGFVIFTTPTGSPCTVARKFWSCWLPSGARSTSRPHRSRTSSATSSAGRFGAGSSPAPKKSNPTRPEGVPAPASAPKTLLSSDIRAPLRFDDIRSVPAPGMGVMANRVVHRRQADADCQGAFVTRGPPPARVSRAARAEKRRSPVASCIVTVVPRRRCASWIAPA